jgi:hypothetical protein
VQSLLHVSAYLGIRVSDPKWVPPTLSAVLLTSQTNDSSSPDPDIDPEDRINISGPTTAQFKLCRRSTYTRVSGMDYPQMVAICDLKQEKYLV